MDRRTAAAVGKFWRGYGSARAHGNPPVATVEKGRQLHAAIVANVVELTRSIEAQPVQIKERTLPL